MCCIAVIVPPQTNTIAIIGSIIAKSKANGSEQTEEDGELLTDEEEKKLVEEDE